MRKSNLKSTLPVLLVSILVIAFGGIAQGFLSDCTWGSGDPHKMHWPQEPDLSSRGVDISMFISTLADDFKCSSSGPINDIHIWGSFMDDILPEDGPDSLTFELSIYSDIPAQGDGWSRPRDLLWTQKFGPGEYSASLVYDGLEDWYDPPRSRYYPDNHRQAYHYNFCIENNPFIQDEGTIYWLVVDEIGPDDPYEADYIFGWKTTTRDLRWNDDAVYLIDGYSQWYEMTYPNEHEYKGQTLDLAFVITGGDGTQFQYDWGDAPDGAGAPGYPTMSFNNGANHKIVGPWLGDDTDFPDPEPDGQPDTHALGDDNDGNDDEDGVSIPPMFQGQPADITLEVNGGGGFVDAWVDFNGDMSWQASEQIFDSFLADGTHTISFIVPADAVLGPTFARFRISKEGFLYPWGPADSGEVEDYQVSIYDNCGQCEGQEFIRGDADQNNQVDDADVTFIMNYLLMGGSKPKCMDAADADDNGVVDIGDTTFILHYVNGGGPPPPAPFPDCGPDPTSDTLTCDQYDYCPGGALIRHAKWFQLPDVTENGIDIRVDSNDGNIRTLADDFECQIESLLTDVHLWCSWKSDIRGVIKRIHLSIHSDDPAGPAGPDPDNLFSKPAPDALWEMDFMQGQFRETLYYTVPEPGEWWWDPYSGELTEGGDRNIWRIDIDIDPSNAFLQEGSASSSKIYWLDVQVDTKDGELGWKTRRWPDQYMDDAVWDVGTELPRIWHELRYPKDHPYHGLEKDSIDMAFCLTYTPDPNKPTFQPVAHTQCPVAATKCPTTATRCPPAKTACPVAATKCPPLETQCPSITTCPPSETRCPYTPTECPAVLTECPVYETRCPQKETKCPAGPTLCYIEQTVCPVADTRCPATYSSCPPVPTQCTAVNTICPYYETRCPEDETYCPVYLTKCPFLETACYAITVCQGDSTTICPYASTQCPIRQTECPYEDTWCPMEDTYCPESFTQCPYTITICSGFDVICPTTIYPQCQVTVYPECQLTVYPCFETAYPLCQVTMFPCVMGTKNSPLVRECPAIETKCPTVISKDLLASGM